MRGLEGRAALVTGAAGGIGRAIAARLGEEGAVGGVLDRSIPMRRLGQPGDVPGAVAFLLSDDAAFITSQTVGVSGDFTMHG